MKRYLTTIFVLLSMVVVFTGFKFDTSWGGIVSWGIAFFLLIVAAYFTKYIPEKPNQKEDVQKFT